MAAKKTTTKKSATKKPVKTPATAKKAPTVAKKAPAKEKKTSTAAKKASAPAKKAPKAVPAKPKPAAKSSKISVAKAPKPAKAKDAVAMLNPQPAALAKEAAQPKANGFHSSAFIKKQRQRLLDLRDELVDSMSGMTRDTIRNAPEGSEASGSGQHQGDAGSDAYDRDFALSVLAKEQDALYEIEQALRRIQAGTYGVCEISSNKIPQARLEAIPFARLTVECQAQWEKEYGKRRFRPSNEVGFSGGNQIDDEDSDSVSLDEDED
jgi:RNA polymerase-binding transcription factor DksA